MPLTPPAVDSDRIAVLESIASVAHGRAGSLDMTSLVSFIVLYAYLLQDGHDADLDFEDFVHDRDALERAAALAQRASGVPTSPPEPLRRLATEA